VAKAQNVASIWFPFGARLLFACAASLTLAWCVASFWFPFGWDQGMFASMGDVIMRGGMPYRDGWEMRGPLPYYVFALAQWLFGRHMWSIRILDLTLFIAGMAAFAFIVARLTSPKGGYWAAITLTIWLSSLTWFHMVEPDNLAAIFIVFAAAALVGKRPSLAQLLFSSIMIGCAGLIKPLFLSFVAMPIVLILEQHRSDKAWLKRTGFVLGMVLVPPLLALAWFAYRGALGDLIDVHILYTLQVYSSVDSPGIRKDISNIMRFFLTGPVSFALPAIVVGSHSLWRDSRNSGLLVLTWAVIALMCVTAQGKFYVYQWIPLFPPLVILAAFGFDRLLSVPFDKNAQGPNGSLRLLSRVVLLLTAFGVLQMATVSASDVVEVLALASGRISNDQYYASFKAGRFVAGDDMEAARYIQAKTTPTDGLAVFGNNALINFLSGRANPTRFIAGGALTVESANVIRAAYRREYINGLQKTLPVYIVVGVPFGALTKEQAVHGFPEFETLLHECYTLETQIGYLDLYRATMLKSAKQP
jgi:hypothetical protein